MLPRRKIRWFASIAVVGVALALVGTVAGFDTGLLHLAPALLLLVPLLAGCYVGEERIAALASVLRPVVPRAVVARLCARLPRALRVTFARGGALLAVALAERGPPAAPVATH